MRLLAPHAPVHIVETECAASDARCFSEAKVRLLETSAKGYDFQVTVAPAPVLKFHIKKDPIAEFRDLAARAMQIAALLPAALALILAFHRDILAGVRRILGLQPTPENNQAS